ncbi:COX15/CtaA family protein [Lacisediminihabitans sp.]|uniref:COX15/CtaA family protein n=1 Tax=Lacisediminihabitans sp. TaxID=2787631 RepID=UPI002F92664A
MNQASPPPQQASPIARAARRWLPGSVDRRVRVLGWLSLLFQVVLVGTGGAVRLTASGLGCPTWPRCTADSFVTTPELGIHGIIEFTNRMLTFVLVLVAIAAFLSVVRMRRERRDLFWLSLSLGLGIPAQAIIGGISVLTGLNPYVVGMHFVVSISLVAIATVFVYRIRFGERPPARTVPRWLTGLTFFTVVVVAITVVVGVLTTGSGPHAGDNSDDKHLAPRNGLNPEILQHVHSWPAYLTVALTMAILASAIVLRLGRLRAAAIGLLAVEALQVIVGVSQARLGLPELLVGIHMVLACVLVAGITTAVLTLRAADGSPAPEASAAQDRELQR